MIFDDIAKMALLGHMYVSQSEDRHVAVCLVNHLIVATCQNIRTSVLASCADVSLRFYWSFAFIPS